MLIFGGNQHCTCFLFPNMSALVRVTAQALEGQNKKMFSGAFFPFFLQNKALFYFHNAVVYHNDANKCVIKPAKYIIGRTG